MSSTIPQTVPSPTVKTNGIDIIDADHINNIQDDIVATANYIGMTGNAQSKLTALINFWRNFFNPLPQITWIDDDTIEIEAKQVAMYSGSNCVFKRNTSAIQIKLSVNLDTGAQAASTWYYVWLCGDTSGTTYTAIFSLSASTPTGYTYCKLIGAVRNDASSNIIKFYQKNNTIWMDALQTFACGSSSSWVEVDITALVPAIATDILLYASPSSTSGISFRHANSADDSNLNIYVNSGYKCPFGWLPVFAGSSYARAIDYKLQNSTLTGYIAAYKIILN